MSTNGATTAAVSDFSLDKFEVTVGRFRKFVDAYPGSRPNPGNGAHPGVAGSGWQSAWDSALPADFDSLQAQLYCSPLYATYHGGYWADDQEHLPITCATWEVAFAFCAWDGGRLPTEAEWNYAAAGGAEQRVYPWSVPANSTEIDDSLAAYWCSNCSPGSPVPVGSRWRGAGRWGHVDLAGNGWEWVRDEYASTYLAPCTDCVRLSGGGEHSIRGGSFGDVADRVSSSSRLPFDGTQYNITFRCARSVVGPVVPDGGQ